MKRKLAILSLSCVLAICVVLLFSTKNVRAAISNSPVTNVDEISKPYTDSDTLLNFTYNGVTKNISQYAAEDDFRPNYQGNQTTDDPITAIIPKQLFMSRGEYLHFGNEYGFYVYTRGVNQEGDGTTIKPSQTSNLVTVILFDITKTISQTNWSCDVTVAPLFCFDYAYIVPTNYYGSQIFYYWQPYYSDWEYGEITKYKSVGFLANGKSDIVIALPDGRYYNDYDGDHYQERWQINERYVIKGASLSFELENTNQLNEGDAGYTPENDNGAFFNFSAVKTKGVTMLSPSTQFITFLRYAAGFVPKLNTIASIADLIAGIIEDDPTHHTSGSQQFNNVFETDYDIDLFPNSKENQLLEFQKLLKNVAVSFSNQENTNNPLLIQPDVNGSNYVQLMSQFNTTSQWQTSLNILFEFSLAFRSGQSTSSLREIETPAVNCGDTNYYFQS